MPELPAEGVKRMAVTVTYLCPLSVQGTTTGPTAAQAAAAQELCATVIATADADTTATITHNWGLSVASLALGHPWIILRETGATSNLSSWYVSSITTNTVVLTKLAATGSGASGAQLTVTLSKPNSLIGQFPTT
jgi:hypothetical protein